MHEMGWQPVVMMALVLLWFGWMAWNDRRADAERQERADARLEEWDRRNGRGDQ